VTIADYPWRHGGSQAEFDARVLVGRIGKRLLLLILVGLIFVDFAALGQRACPVPEPVAAARRPAFVVHAAR
jgi:hypothetical protein